MSERVSELEEMGLDGLTADPLNARRHTERGIGLIAGALGEVGAARSVVIDEAGRVLAGNATVEAARRAGITAVRVVDADGQTLIAVRRSGLTEGQKARLALLDNRAGELSGWDPAALSALLETGASPDGLWTPAELAALLGPEAGETGGPTPPEEFPGYDEGIATEYRCPRCAYQWSGRAK